MKGNSQNVDISYSVVDGIFNNNIVKIENMLLTGGEPTLVSLDKIKYLVDVIKNKEVNISNVSIVSNGVIFSEEFIRVLAEIKAKISLQFSVDYYHPDIKQNIVDAYKNISSKYNLYVYPLESRENFVEKRLYNLGRAKINRLGGFKYDVSKLGQKIYSLKNDDNYYCSSHIYINAKGFVTNSGNGTYKATDIINLGNIKRKKLLKMFCITM